MKNRRKNSQDYGSILSGEQKKQLVKEMRKEGRRKHLSVQKTIPFETMFPDGICMVNDHYFTKMIQFDDINYRLLGREDCEIIFDAWCSLYNYFGPEVHLQMCFTVEKADLLEMKRNVTLSDKDDGYNNLRHEFSAMLQEKLEQGNNDYIRRKYIVFGVDGRDRKTVKGKLMHIGEDIENILSPIGVRTHVLSGYERLHVLRNLMTPESFEPFTYNFDLTTRTGLTCKDFIAPTGFDFRSTEYFRSGSFFGTSCFFQMQTEKLDDHLMGQMLEVNSNIMASIHVQSIDQEKALKLLKGKLTDVEGMKIDEQKRAVHAGYDMDLLPPDIETYGKSIQKTLDDVEAGDDRIFNATFVITVLEKSRQKLDRVVDQLKGIARQGSCAVKCLDSRQEDGFMSSLPIGVNHVKVTSARTTRAVAGLVPFTTVELFQKTGQQLYGGVNQLSGNLLMIDRKTLDNPNGLILGTPGAGKSFATKEEIFNTFFATDDSIMISDPESEYGEMVKAIGGEVVVISPVSKDHINPLDLYVPPDGSAEDAVKLKIDFVLSLFELIIGDSGGFESIEKSIIDIAAGNVYERYLKNPVPENMPILEDLYNEIRTMDRPKAELLSTKMERFVHGSSNLFNFRTNVDLKSRIICFDIRSLGTQLKTIGMMTVQDEVWNRVIQNRSVLKNTRYYMDEMHLLLRDPLTAGYTVEMYKRFRKYGGIPTGITQNITDLLGSTQISNIFSNCEYIRMLKQRGDDREELQEKLHISDEQMKYVTGSKRGSGLLFFGDRIVPFKDDFPKNTELYRLINTKLEDMTPQKEAGNDDADKE